MVGRPVRILGKVDVKTLSRLGVVVVGCAKEFDEANVVEEEVEFGNVETRAYSEVDKNIACIVEGGESSIKRKECVTRLCARDIEPGL